jgi:hypothetical protein
VRIDISNDLDAAWKIDVKKASAQPPTPVRERLRRIIEAIGAGSKRVYTSRGKKLVSENPLPVWTKIQDKNAISYGVNFDHPAFRRFTQSLTVEQSQEFTRLLSLIASTIPIDTLFADVSSYPESVSTNALDDDTLNRLVTETYLTLRSENFSDDEIHLMIAAAEPFRSNWAVAKDVLISLQGNNGK